ncbi:MAG: hypothetical protein JAY92_08740 [Candidatus Thiodiazotropha lotti]|nr:hypothetical protein [Candidatus Thiodiazotropha lotti]MCG7989415.1 hypothetical protein [Candidatus Thiodiazotropha lotti]MCG8008723.1 hypothetical protein [Candidatus Thiodiazotropha lotti]MCG8010539.1 hypothetical protein [Candidatus Thiodiazotropha lotti]MCG8019260.1 hypothetical protein [Candidatus Thiodiazotropha lotti]
MYTPLMPTTAAVALYTSQQGKREDKGLVIDYLIPIKPSKIKQVAE